MSIVLYYAAALIYAFDVAKAARVATRDRGA
jgi:hypothetical protein